MNSISKLLLNSIKKFNQKKISIHEPDVNKSDVKLLKNCVYSRNVSATGKYCNDFEKEIKKITKSKFVVLTNSGTSALHISCLLSGINSAHEVLIPAFTFVASPNAVIYCNASPHFVEIESENFGIDFEKLRNYLKKISIKKKGKLINKKTKKIIKAIMIVHPIGYPINYDELTKFKKEYNLIVIEDAADALGSYFKGKHAGTFGKFGVLSFNGNKIITTGTGGAILVQNKTLAIKAKKLVQTSKVNHKFRFIHDQLGFNYRMSNLHAALGLSQIKRLKKILSNKKKLNRYYNQAFKKHSYFKLINETKDKRFNFWLQTIVIKKKYSNHINLILNDLYKNNIFLRQGWDLMPSLKFLKKYPSMKLNIAKNIQKRILHLPSSSFLKKK
jgi:perosamine synthetase